MKKSRLTISGRSWSINNYHKNHWSSSSSSWKSDFRTKKKGTDVSQRSLDAAKERSFENVKKRISPIAVHVPTLKAVTNGLRCSMPAPMVPDMLQNLFSRNIKSQCWWYLRKIPLWTHSVASGLSIWSFDYWAVWNRILWRRFGRNKWRRKDCVAHRQCQRKFEYCSIFKGNVSCWCGSQEQWRYDVGPKVPPHR